MFNYEFLKIDYLNYSSLLYYACEFHILAPDGATLTSFFIAFLFVFLLFIDGKAGPLDTTAVSTDIVREPPPASNVNVRVPTIPYSPSECSMLPVNHFFKESLEKFNLFLGDAQYHDGREPQCKLVQLNLNHK